MELKETELKFRLTKSEKEAITQQARQEQLSVSEYLRLRALKPKLKRARA
jgi:hypothetical protein